MKAKTLALLIAGTIVVGAGAAIAIATPTSLKHNSISGFFDDIFSSQSQPEEHPVNTPSITSEAQEAGTPASTASTGSGISQASHSESQQSISYTVPGVVPLVAQPSPNTCWAAVATMMVSWHEQSSFTIEQVADRAGVIYRQKVDKAGGEGLYGDEKPQLLSALGMKSEVPQSYSIRDILNLLQKYGPLWVTTDEPGIHARIIIGISGDGTPNGTYLRLMNPEPVKVGRIDSETFRNFAQKFDNVAFGDMNDGFGLRVQLVHF